MRDHQVDIVAKGPRVATHDQVGAIRSGAATGVLVPLPGLVHLRHPVIELDPVPAIRRREGSDRPRVADRIDERDPGDPQHRGDDQRQPKSAVERHSAHGYPVSIWMRSRRAGPVRPAGRTGLESWARYYYRLVRTAVIGYGPSKKTIPRQFPPTFQTKVQHARLRPRGCPDTEHSRGIRARTTGAQQFGDRRAARH